VYDAIFCARNLGPAPRKTPTLSNAGKLGIVGSCNLTVFNKPLDRFGTPRVDTADATDVGAPNADTAPLIVAGTPKVLAAPINVVGVPLNGLAEIAAKDKFGELATFTKDPPPTDKAGADSTENPADVGDDIFTRFDVTPLEIFAGALDIA
jgi:hypothetical protein